MQQETILVATLNDNRLLELALAGLEHGFKYATTAEDTLAHLRDHTPSLIILDAHLADIRGTVLCDRFKRVPRLKQVPIVLLVNAHDSHMLEDARMSRADEVVTKPFMGHRIRSLVTQLLTHPLALKAEKQVGKEPLKPS